MATGSGFLDAQGVWQFGEDDDEGLVSDTWNLGQEATSLQFEADRVRLTDLEDDADHPTTFVAASAATRDTHWGTPSTASTRRALQDLGATTIRLDTGWTERYYANKTDGGANPGGTTVAGWYPVTGKVPFVWLKMTTAQNFANAGVNQPVNWDTEVMDDLNWHNPAVNPSRITVPIAGRYRATRALTGNSAAASQYVAAAFRVNGAQVLGTYASYPAVATVNFPANLASFDLILVAGDYVEIEAQGVSGTATVIQVAQSLFQLEYMGPA